MNVVRRKEHKYIISYVDYLKIKSIIENILVHDKHGDEDSYPVNSIYFDDIVFNAASDKAFGNELHKKYRIRYYDDLTKIKFELKKKQAEQTEKSSISLDNDTYRKLLDDEFIDIEKSNKLLNRFTLDKQLSNLEPKVFISYQREAYRDEVDNVRITFDHSLEGGWFNEGDTIYNKLINDGFLILEIKYKYTLSNVIKEVINKVKPNQIAYSKYFMGYQSLGI